MAQTLFIPIAILVFAVFSCRFFTFFGYGERKAKQHF